MKDEPTFWQKIVAALPRKKKSPWRNFADTAADALGEAAGRAAAAGFDNLVQRLNEPQSRPLILPNLPHDAQTLIALAQKTIEETVAVYPSRQEFMDAVLDHFVDYRAAHRVPFPCVAAYNPFLDIVVDILDETPLDVNQKLYTTAQLNSIEGARARDLLRSFISLYAEPRRLFAEFRVTAFDLLVRLSGRLPPLAQAHDTLTPPATKFAVPLVDIMPAPAECIVALCEPFCSPYFLPTPFFQSFRSRLEHNTNTISGTTDPNKQIPPSKFKGSPREMIDAYLGGTFLRPLFDAEIPFPLTSYKQHHWMIYARTGHGKTQTLQAIILEHLQEDDPPPMIIIDTQSNLRHNTGLLANIERLAMFDDKLRDRLVVVDARADDHPALNMFHVPHMDDETENEVVGLYSYIFSALDQTLTGQQDTMFAFVTRLMIAHHRRTGGGTAATLSGLMKLMVEQPKTIADSDFAETIETMDEVTREYFASRFFATDTAQTRRLIANRLFAVLSVPAFARMFNAPTNTLDLYDAIAKRKIVIIAPGGLGEDRGTPVFARYMIALALRAAYQRADIPEEDRHPALLFIDEAAGLIDAKIETILIRARKFGLFLRLAAQFPAQIPNEFRPAVHNNCEVFMAGGLIEDDCKTLASIMRTTPDVLLNTTKREKVSTEMVTYVQGQTPTAVTLSIPFLQMEAAPRSEGPGYAARRRASRAALAAPRTVPPPVPPTPKPPPDDGDHTESY